MAHRTPSRITLGFLTVRPYRVMVAALLSSGRAAAFKVTEFDPIVSAESISSSADAPSLTRFMGAPAEEKEILPEALPSSSEVKAVRSALAKSVLWENLVILGNGQPEALTEARSGAGVFGQRSDELGMPSLSESGVSMPSCGTKLPSVVKMILSSLVSGSRPRNVTVCSPEENWNCLGFSLRKLMVPPLAILPVILVHCQFGDQRFSAVFQMSSASPSTDT